MKIQNFQRIQKQHLG